MYTLGKIVQGRTDAGPTTSGSFLLIDTWYTEDLDSTEKWVVEKVVEIGTINRGKMWRMMKHTRVCSVRYVPRHTAGIYRRYYRYRTLR